MKISGYTTKHTNIKFVNDHLTKHKKSEAFACGVADFISGELTYRKFKPRLMAEVSGGEILLSGKLTFEFKDRFKELGGKWNPKKKSWSFNQQKQETLKKEVRKLLRQIIKTHDEDIQELLLGTRTFSEENFEDIWSGSWNIWINEYNNGKEWALSNAQSIEKDTKNLIKWKTKPL